MVDHTKHMKFNSSINPILIIINFEIGGKLILKAVKQY